ncbi:MAG: type II CAAX endopeptidase family protein [Candidatus Saccharibacteria bacterium]|nr:type II CAAX endopeptidase family protein [Candidatus Saccharibacteria bacterium]
MVRQKTTEQVKTAAKVPPRPKWHVWLWALGLPLWVYGGFLAAQFTVAAAVWGLATIGVSLQLVDTTLLTTIIAAASYGLALAVVAGLPWWFYRRRTTCRELGVAGRPEWLDIALPPLTFLVYMVATVVVMALVTSFLPIDMTQKQALPFDQSSSIVLWQQLLICFTLVIAAPVAEELLFRGYLYAKLRVLVPAWATVLLTAAAFGLAHAWAGPGHALQWMVVVDTMVLGVFLGSLREHTGAIWASIGLHMIKNGLAFYFLFVNPNVIQQLNAALLPLL